MATVPRKDAMTAMNRMINCLIKKHVANRIPTKIIHKPNTGSSNGDPASNIPSFGN